jgi:hypothetical protein
MIKTISDSQIEIIKNIQKLYTGDIECDVTFSKGAFWKGLIEPAFRFDVCPHISRQDVMQADCRNLPLKDGSMKSLMFDPPFIVAHGKESIIGNRFSSYKNIKELWNFYEDSIKEFSRVISKKGYLVVKCQDVVSGGRNHLSHVFICNKAEEYGFENVDLFVLTAKHRMTTHNTTIQKHARKYHSYFLVFQRK